MHTRDRAERAICYLGFVRLIYHTVADMYRFGFEACSFIPDEMKKMYRALNTTQPLDMES